jgi:CheY-like chemotaxis protein
MPECAILVVEDDDTIRQQVARSLQQDGYEVLQASTGHETIRILERKPICLILTDRKMPWMDGDWLLTYVRTNYPKIPVAFLTGYEEGLDQLSPDAVLMKPFKKRDLRKLVKSLLKQPSEPA